jgi:hypothetical protein
MNRTDLQALSETRLADGAVLLRAGRYSGAYYMLGYAVECALKASVAKQIREHDFPDKKLVVDSHTHDLGKLLNLSGLRAAFDQKTASDSAFAVNWATTKDWNESTRYSTTITEIVARDLHAAITDSASGVLPWLKTQW